MGQFSMTTLADAESLSLGRYRAQSDVPSLSRQQPFDPNDSLAPAKRHPAPSMADAAALSSTSALLTLAGIGVGVGLGTLLSYLEASAVVVAWIQLPGQLYLDALHCVIVPATFCMVMVAVADAVTCGTARRIALVAALWFALSALLAAAVGTLTAMLFQSAWRPSSLQDATTDLPQLTVQCASRQWLTMNTASGAITCGAASSSMNATDRNGVFTVHRSKVVFARTEALFAAVSVTDQIVGMLSNLVPINVLTGFVDGPFVSVVFTAFVFAVACVQGHDTHQGPTPNYVILLVTQAGVLLRMLVNTLTRLLPFAAIPIVAGAIATAKTTLGVVHGAVYLGLALVTAAVVFLFVALAAALYLSAHCHLCRFFRHLLPAQAFALATASNIATLPLTVQCVDATGDVPRALNRIVVALGATCNLTGMSLYTPLAVVFLTQVSGLSNQLTAAKYVQLWLLSAVAGFGAKTVESAEMVMVLTVWRAVVGINGEPSGLVATLVVADWFAQRVRTVVNVTCHAIIARIVAEHCREGERQQFVDASHSTAPVDSVENHDFVRDTTRGPMHHF